MVERRLGAHAHEFMRADLDDRHAKVIMEVRDDVFRHWEAPVESAWTGKVDAGFPIRPCSNERRPDHSGLESRFLEQTEKLAWEAWVLPCNCRHHYITPGAAE